ncbi:MAG: transcriptional regulator [Jatrophihabitantaceae bacterium]|nr:transcriptional regulator [Jatrophihabitantaceae bacterium]
MYTPAHFALTPEQASLALRAGGLAHLVTPTADGLVSTPVPMYLDEKRGALLGLVARSNPHWQAVATGESLAIFAGVDAYVSPGLYASKAEHGRVVPTWNYEVLHVHGALIAHDDVDWLRAQVQRLTDRHEAGRAQPWRVTDAPERFVAGQLRAIVGLELSVARVEGKAKLSQNRPEADQLGVIVGLGASAHAADRAMAEAVASARPGAVE